MPGTAQHLLQVTATPPLRLRQFGMPTITGGIPQE
jgi:hypothetical protein